MNDTLTIINIVATFILPLILAFAYVIRKIRKSECKNKGCCNTVSESDVDVKP